MTNKKKIQKIKAVCLDWLRIYPTFDAMLKDTLSTMFLTVRGADKDVINFSDVEFQPFIGCYIAAYIRLFKLDELDDTTRDIDIAIFKVRDEIKRLVTIRRKDLNKDEKKYGNLESTIYCDAGLTVKSFRLANNAFKLVATKNKFGDTLIDFIVYYLAKFKLLDAFLIYFAEVKS